MKKLALVFIIVPSLVFAGFTVQPGQWEYDTRVVAMGKETVAQKTFVCVTKEMAESYDEIVIDQLENAMSGCIEVLEHTDSKIKAAVKCNINGNEYEGISKVERKSGKKIISTSINTVYIDGQKEEVEAKITQKWVSESCEAQ